MKQPRHRHGYHALKRKVKLAPGAIDRRTAAGREHLDRERELVMALGGDANLSPQRRRLVDLAVRASLLLDAVDAWIFGQTRLVNGTTKSLPPVAIQRQAIAEHLAKTLDRLGLDRQVGKVEDPWEYAARVYGNRPEEGERNYQADLDQVVEDEDAQVDDPGAQDERPDAADVSDAGPHGLSSRF